jgi:hypothetical protein
MQHRNHHFVPASFHQVETLSKQLIFMNFFLGAPPHSGLSSHCSNANVALSRAVAPAPRSRLLQQGLGSTIPIHARQTGRAILTGPCSGTKAVSVFAYRTAALPRASARGTR